MAFINLSGAIKVVETIIKCKPLVDYLVDFKYRKLDYYFKYYNKTVTVFCNGHGIIKHEFIIRVVNPAKCKYIRRSLDVSDGKDAIKFPSLDYMKNVKVSSRFVDYGTWIESEPPIVTPASIKEFYWSPALREEEEDMSRKRNSKELRWRIHLDSCKLKKHKEYRIAQYLSIPGLFPITNCHYDHDNANTKIEDEEKRFCETSILVDRPTTKIDFMLSLEKGIELDYMPECYPTRRTIDGNVDYYPSSTENNDDIFYNKWLFSIKHPCIDDNITIKWKVTSS